MKSNERTSTMKHHLAILLTVLIVLIIQPFALAQEGRFVNDMVHSQGLEGNLLGDSADRRVLNRRVAGLSGSQWEVMARLNSP